MRVCTCRMTGGFVIHCKLYLGGGGGGGSGEGGGQLVKQASNGTANTLPWLVIGPGCMYCTRV